MNPESVANNNSLFESLKKSQQKSGEGLDQWSSAFAVHAKPKSRIVDALTLSRMSLASLLYYVLVGDGAILS